MSQYFLFICFALICLTDSVPPPSNLKICKNDDFKCMVESAKAYIPTFVKGEPAYNLPAVDPTQFKIINASQADLLFVLTDVTVTGLKNCEPKRIERDSNAKKMHIQILCTGRLDGQYELRGNLLFVPIEGKGPIHVDLRSALVNIELQLADKEGEDGKIHWQIKTWTHSFELKGKSDVVFENLYKDNEVLGRAARDLIANNGNDIVTEIGPPVIKALVARIIKYINYFFKAVDAEDLSLN